MRDTIQKRQNEEHMLKIQCSARGYYNNAEKIGKLAWLFCLISAVSLIIPESVPLACQLTIPVIADIAALLLSKKQDESVEKAALFRAYFDAYVLGINDRYKQYERDKIVGDAREYCGKHIKKSSVQITTTGFDTPPGVKDWYDLMGEREYHNNNEVVFECQKQNVWWEERLSKSRIRILVAVSGILLLLIMAAFVVYDGHIIIRSVLSSALLVKAIERIVAEYKFAKISHEIDGAISVMNGKPDIKSIEELQKLIDAKRRCNVVGINWLHKRKAKNLSKTYRSRSQG